MFYDTACRERGDCRGRSFRPDEVRLDDHTPTRLAGERSRNLHRDRERAESEYGDCGRRRDLCMPDDRGCGEVSRLHQSSAHGVGSNYLEKERRRLGNLWGERCLSYEQNNGCCHPRHDDRRRHRAWVSSTAAVLAEIFGAARAGKERLAASLANAHTALVLTSLIKFSEPYLFIERLLVKGEKLI